jgi:hypothetical protein
MGLRDEDPAWRKTGDGDLAQLATEMASAVKDKVQDWSAGAQETARTAATQIADKAASVAESASQTLHDVGTTARETFIQAREGAASMAERASVNVQQAMPDREDRDKFLLGARPRSPSPPWWALPISGARRGPELDDRRCDDPGLVGSAARYGQPLAGAQGCPPRSGAGVLLHILAWTGDRHRDRDRGQRRAFLTSTAVGSLAKPARLRRWWLERASVSWVLF